MRALDAYRDDGPVALLCARAPALPTGLVGIALGVAPLLAALAAEGGAGPWTGVALAWCILVVGGTAGRPPSGRFAWLEPVAVRCAEYAFVVAVIALARPRALPAAYAFAFAAAMHHYEIVYRLRHLGEAPPAWVGLVAGGWEMRMALAYLLARTDATAEGLFAYAVAAGTLFIGESAVVWSRAGRGSAA